jgi:hypothetical protein
MTHDDLPAALAAARRQAEAAGLALDVQVARGELLLLLYAGEQLRLTWRPQYKLAQHADASRPVRCPTWQAALELAAGADNRSDVHHA